MSNVCIIPARGGSQRIPNKNIKLFHGKPIIAYTIETAIESELFDEIIVSSDSREIIDIAVSHGADYGHLRSYNMAQDEIGTQEVITNVLTEAGKTDGLACCIYATSPLMSPEDLRRGRDVLLEYLGLHYAMSVGAHPLCDAGQFYWGYVTSFLNEKELITPYTAMVPIYDKRVCDINTMSDWTSAEEMYLAL